jgi:hypothetical protein
MCKVNQACEAFELSKLTENTFKCLIFVCVHKSSRDSDIWTRLLSRLQSDPELTVEKLADEAMEILSLKHDTVCLEQPSTSAVVQQVSHYPKGRKSNQRDSKAKKPPYPCPKCGGDRYMKLCEYKNHKCRDCNTFGHKEVHCRDKSTAPSELKPHKGQCYKSNGSKYMTGKIGRISSLTVDTVRLIAVSSMETRSKLASLWPMTASGVLELS